MAYMSGVTYFKSVAEAKINQPIHHGQVEYNPK